MAAETENEQNSFPLTVASRRIDRRPTTIIDDVAVVAELRGATASATVKINNLTKAFICA